MAVLTGLRLTAVERTEAFRVVRPGTALGQVFA